MELLFLWIKGLNNFSDISLNFSNQFRFTFDEVKNSLTIKSAENYVDGFFAKNITNLTGIIGANGIGKTSILRFILGYCSEGTGNKFPYDSVMVFKNNQKFFYIGPLRLKLDGLPIKELFEKVSNADDFKSATNVVYLSTQFDPTSFYAFDYTKIQLANTKNLSTWYLLDSDIQTRTGKDYTKKDIPFYDKIEAFASLEFMRMVKVLRWINRRIERNPFPVSMPPYLNLKFNNFQDQPNSNLFHSISQLLYRYFKFGSSPKNTFLLNAFQATLFHFFDESRFSIGPKQVTEEYDRLLNKLMEYLKKNSYKKSPKNSIIYELNSIIGALSEGPETFNIFKQKLEIIREFLNKLEVFVFSRHVKVDESDRILSIALKEANLKLLEDLIDAYFRVEKIGESAVFYFSHQFFTVSSLSSGEYTLLSLFGRLNELKFRRGASILLLIDEAELTLHPEWQKQFISLFLDFIGEKFSYVKVQIVLTSHSPFILSDLPPHCVTLLKKENNRTIVVDSLERKNETFGANIHELFTDSFFLQDSLIGEFARRKIENLIARVNTQSKYSQDEYNQLKREIDMIGEPYVRFKLLEKVMSGMSVDTFDNVIQEREKELNLIKQTRRDKNRG